MHLCVGNASGAEGPWDGVCGLVVAGMRVEGMGCFRPWVWVVGWSRMWGRVPWEVLQGAGEGVGCKVCPQK